MRYRVKASGVNGVLVSAQGEVSPKGPPPELEGTSQRGQASTS